MAYISRTAKDIENLFRYSESSVFCAKALCHQIFSHATGSPRKFDLKKICIFINLSQFLRIYAMFKSEYLARTSSDFRKIHQMHSKKYRIDHGVFLS